MRISRLRVVPKSKAVVPAALLIVLATLAMAQRMLVAAERSGSGETLSREMLNSHNLVRQSRGVGPLAWSEPLAQQAKAWANRLASEGRLYHHPNPQFGENLFLISGGEASARSVVDAWASEAKDYDYSSNSCRSRCGHYTQLVWRDTKEVGCGVGRSQRIEVWVCEYNPPGNIAGERPY